MKNTGAARCWGIYRELAHSPGRETDDAEILRATAGELSARGFGVDLKSADELPEAEDFAAVPPFLFVMCERVPVVDKLAAWERRGARIVNRPAGIRNTDRERTLALFRRHGVPFPESVLVETASDGADFSGPCWIKRGDVHATEAADVAFAADPRSLAAHLERLAGRGIARAVVQRHVAGDLVKFYGVAGLGDAPDVPILVSVVLPSRPGASRSIPSTPRRSPPRPPAPPRRSRSRSTAATPSFPRTAASTSST